jgi:mRNA-degrading endonuclease RelE of RelBE toxin-antitoxin system
MEILFLDAARKEFERLPNDLQHLFLSHFEKIQSMPPRRHLRYGTPSHVEKVTRKARIIYEIHEDTMYILHCFADHKEYEQWYNSYR